jgi:hypothetical protein
VKEMIRLPALDFTLLPFASATCGAELDCFDSALMICSASAKKLFEFLGLSTKNGSLVVQVVRTKNGSLVILKVPLLSHFILSYFILSLSLKDQTKKRTKDGPNNQTEKNQPALIPWPNQNGNPLQPPNI